MIGLEDGLNYLSLQVFKKFVILLLLILLVCRAIVIELKTKI